MALCSAHHGGRLREFGQSAQGVEDDRRIVDDLRRADIAVADLCLHYVRHNYTEYRTGEIERRVLVPRYAGDADRLDADADALGRIRRNRARAELLLSLLAEPQRH